MVLRSPTPVKLAFLLPAIFVVVLFGCKKEVRLPKVTTNAASGITPNGAICGGIINDDDAAKVTAYGVCWSNDHPPTIADNHTVDGKGNGSFSSTMTGLASSTTYFVRAYASNRCGTAYGNTTTFTTQHNGALVTDIDGNVYHTINIGSQVWMVENLRVRHFRNGTPLNYVSFSDSLSWNSIVHSNYCEYENIPGNEEKFGLLYNQRCIMDTNGLAPLGWHVPSINEFKTLIEYLGGEPLAGGRLKEAGMEHWTSPNLGAWNSSGFTALPGGRRIYHGRYEGFGNIGNFWTSYPSWTLQLGYDNQRALLYVYPRDAGMSVRCIKD